MSISALPSVRSVLAGVALLAAGFCLGWFSHGAEPAREAPAAPEQPGAATGLPETDVPGRELAGLPRYPSSVRTKHEQLEEDGLRVQEVKYLTEADAERVREFYRGVFEAEDWAVADVEFSREDWRFLLLSSEREAVVEIEPQNGLEEGLVEIEFELSVPA